MPFVMYQSKLPPKTGSLSRFFGAKIGCREQKTSGKTHAVGFSRENQARKPTLEHIQEVPKRKLGVGSKNQAKKHTSWVFEEKSKL